MVMGVIGVGIFWIIARFLLSYTSFDILIMLSNVEPLRPRVLQYPTI